jgi:lysozyme
MINSVIDLSHHNKVTDFAKVKADQIVGIIHKATQGFNYVDQTFAIHTKKAADAGLLVGAYHFGTAGDPIAQAEHLIDTAGDKTLLVLDFEGNPQGHDMSLEEAEHFVNHIKSITGRYPGLYSGHAIKETLTKAGITQPDQTELSQCWLWLAQYSNAPLLPKAWKSWTMWQYTDGGAGPTPHEVKGIGFCDRNQFNGTEQQLIDFWKHNSQ